MYLRFHLPDAGFGFGGSCFGFGALGFNLGGSCFRFGAGPGCNLALFSGFGNSLSGSGAGLHRSSCAGLGLLACLNLLRVASQVGSFFWIEQPQRSFHKVQLQSKCLAIQTQPPASQHPRWYPFVLLSFL